MRIVTGGAADTRVIGIVALAVRQTIRLETNIDNAPDSGSSNLVPRAMTLTAEVGHLFARERSEVIHLCKLGIAASNVLDVVVCRSVATLALHAWRHFVQSQLSRFRCVRSVAAKTS